MSQVEAQERLALAAARKSYYWWGTAKPEVDESVSFVVAPSFKFMNIDLVSHSHILCFLPKSKVKVS